MAQIGKTFRIFVSSTFSDLKQERNALQKNVFPKLRELCTSYGCRFQAIDLRWGVSEEAGLDQQTMKICLEEVARCQETTPRPNFIVLLGDRYGWRPLPYEIEATEFEEILKNVKNSGDIELLTCWYCRDDNAVPPIYCLQPRSGEYTDSDRWKVLEHKIRSIMLEAMAGLQLGPADKLKYSEAKLKQFEQELANHLSNGSSVSFKAELEKYNSLLNSIQEEITEKKNEEKKIMSKLKE